MYACLFGTSRDLAALARQFSPLVESVLPEAVVFSIAGLGRLIGDTHQIASEISRQGEQMGITANLGIAANPSAAVLAARNLAGVTILPPGREAEMLAPIPIEALPASPEMALTFSRWGIRTLGDLAALPPLGLLERLGETGNRLRRLALGEGDAILDVRLPLPEYTIRQELDDPVETFEPLLFLLSSQLHELAGQLQRNGQAANRITVDLTLDRGEFQRVLTLPVPMRDARALFKQVQVALETSPPDAAVLAVQVTLAPAAPRVLQHGLFFPAVPEPEKLQTLLARLHALVGEECVGSPEILNTHRPDAYRLRPCAFQPSEPREAPHGELRLAFRYFRPPLAARVTMHGNRLRHIVSERVAGDIVQAAGPWRSSGDWWTSGSAWDRDEWDIVLENRAIYRVCCAEEQWFLEGSYD